jgi:hypothetical protein
MDAGQQEGRAPEEMRRHKRFVLTALGRFMRADKHEYPCRLNDISVGGCSIWSPVQPELDERVVVYFDHLGMLDGHVVRAFEGGFSMRFNITAHKREKLAAQIMWLLNKHELDPSDERRHERYVPSKRTITLHLADGFEATCTILDVSLSGAAVATEARPPIGSEVKLGKLRSKVTRHLSNGIGVQFLAVQDAEALRGTFG